MYRFFSIIVVSAFISTSNSQFGGTNYYPDVCKSNNNIVPLGRCVTSNCPVGNKCSVFYMELRWAPQFTMTQQINLCICSQASCPVSEVDNGKCKTFSQLSSYGKSQLTALLRQTGTIANNYETEYNFLQSQFDQSNLCCFPGEKYGYYNSSTSHTIKKSIFSALIALLIYLGVVMPQ